MNKAGCANPWQGRSAWITYNATLKIDHISGLLCVRCRRPRPFMTLTGICAASV